VNTRNSLEDRILEDFRNLPENLRNKFLDLIRHLKAEASTQNNACEKPQWTRQDEEFFDAWQNRHFKIDKDTDIDGLMQDMNNGIS